MVDWSPFFEPDDFFALDPALYYYFYDEIDYVVVSTKELNEVSCDSVSVTNLNKCKIFNKMFLNISSAKCYFVQDSML